MSKVDGYRIVTRDEAAVLAKMGVEVRASRNGWVDHPHPVQLEGPEDWAFADSAHRPWSFYIREESGGASTPFGDAVDGGTTA